MKADGEFGWESGREPEELRAILRQWKVPPPPREIEEELRRTFRRRRSNRRSILWLAAAASLALLLVYQAKPPGRPTPLVVVERPAFRTPPPAPLVEAPRREARATPDPAARRPWTAAAPPLEGLVIVEPRQAELLAQLARQLQGARGAQPAVSLPRIEAVPADAPAPPVRAAPARDTVLEYSAHWETVGNEWPFMHRPL